MAAKGPVAVAGDLKTNLSLRNNSISKQHLYKYEWVKTPIYQLLQMKLNTAVCSVNL
jgi:hypothetical protein